MKEVSNDELPEGWTKAALQDVASWGSGGTPSRKNPSYFGGDIPWIKTGELDSGLILQTEEHLTHEGLKNSSAKVFPKGAVAVAMYGATIGKASILGIDAATNQACAVAIPDKRLTTSHYLFHYLRSQKEAFVGAGKGGAQPNISQGLIKEWPLPLAPLAEQKRIADKLEAVLGRVEACRARLDRVPDLLKRFRQSVLAAATSGQLTEDWRDEHHIDGDWPEERLESLTCKVGSGATPRGGESAYKSEGVPLIRSMNVIFFGFKEEGIAFLDQDQAHDLRSAEVKAHDVLLNITGASIGRVTVAPAKFEGARVNQHVCIIRSKPQLSPKFLCWFLSAPMMQGAITAENYGVTRQALTKQQILDFAIPLPTSQEQQEIVRRVEALFAFADRIETRLTEARAQVERLTPATLAKAFRGELVPQDPNDEPASVLLSNLKKPYSGSVDRKENRSPSPYRKPTPKKNTPAMTEKNIRSDNRVEQLSDFKLHRLKLNGRFGRLLDFDECLRMTSPRDTTPICMVGLNGSGKSNVLEALSEIFTHLELILLPWHRGTKRKTSSLSFELEYTVQFGRKPPRSIKIWKGTEGNAQYSETLADGLDREITSPDEQRSLLPRRVIGYSSGMNETLSLPYFKLTALYVKEVALAVRRGQDEDDYVAEPRSLFIDYESNAAILLANFLFAPPSKLALFKHHIRVEEVESFTIRFNAKPPALKSGVKLTGQLTNDLDKIAKCAGTTFDPVLDENVFVFRDAKFYRKRFADDFPDGGSEFFMALHRLSLLNALCVHSGTTDEYEQNDPRAGSVDRPQIVARLDRIFSIENVKLRLSAPIPKPTIAYESLSDGEHQFIEIFGTVMLFNEPGTLFLLDEPESHFNPTWRSQFVQILAECGNVRRQEMALSTHSPFIVSGCRGESVFKFERKGKGAVCKPADFETYGSSFDYLLTRLFDMDALIATQPLEGMKRVFRNGNLEDLNRALVEFGDSFEKRFIFQRIAEKKLQQRKRTAKKTAKKTVRKVAITAQEKQKRR